MQKRNPRITSNFERGTKLNGISQVVSIGGKYQFPVKRFHLSAFSQYIATFSYLPLRPGPIFVNKNDSCIISLGFFWDFVDKVQLRNVFLLDILVDRALTILPYSNFKMRSTKYGC